ncbi:hypothetical protein [Cellulomonas sp.]|uniref:hypothetical protein n=1 Tax=Cellulomonas sp. TaxID=40001 RepID=UPI00258A0729|nr:hypothetical protein [Cellulomonas sp.]
MPALGSPSTSNAASAGCCRRAWLFLFAFFAAGVTIGGMAGMRGLRWTDAGAVGGVAGALWKEKLVGILGTTWVVARLTRRGSPTLPESGVDAGMARCSGSRVHGLVHR